MAVPLRISILVAQPEIGGHVEDLDPGVGFENRRDDLLRGAVRQPAEHRVEPAPVDLFPFDEFWQVEHEEMRKHIAHGLAGMGIGGERGDLGIRMPRQQAHRVGSGVAGRAENADLLRAHHAFLSGEIVCLSCTAAAAKASGRAARITSANARTSLVHPALLAERQPVTCRQAPASAACSARLRPTRPCPDCPAARPAPPGDVSRWQRRKARACWSR